MCRGPIARRLKKLKLLLGHGVGSVGLESVVVQQDLVTNVCGPAVPQRRE